VRRSQAKCFPAAILFAGLMIAPSWAAGDEPFRSVETTSYRVQYGPSHLAEMNVEVSCGTEGIVTARLSAESQGFARRIHAFQVRLDSRLDLGRGSTSQAQTFIVEKGQLRRFRSQFDTTPQVATEALRHGETHREQVRLPDLGQDLLSWILELRQRIATEGVQEQPLRYPLWDGWKLVYLDVTPGQVEELWTPVGDVEAQAFTLQRTRLHHTGPFLFEAQRDAEELGTIWIETAPRALPVSMTFRAPIGRVRIELHELTEEQCPQ
jgi:hypothetical protein